METARSCGEKTVNFRTIWLCYTQDDGSLPLQVSLKLLAFIPYSSCYMSFVTERVAANVGVTRHTGLAYSAHIQYKHYDKQTRGLREIMYTNGTHTDRNLTAMNTRGHGGSTNGPIYWHFGNDDNYGLHQTATLTSVTSTLRQGLPTVHQENNTFHNHKFWIQV